MVCREREAGPAILESEPAAFWNDGTTKASIVGIDEGSRVTLRINDGEVYRVTRAKCRGTMDRCFCGDRGIEEF